MTKILEQLQNCIEPIIKDFIDSMELGIPRCVVTSEKRNNTCLVIVRVKKGLNCKHSFIYLLLSSGLRSIRPWVQQSMETFDVAVH